MFEVRETEAYTIWFNGLRDTQARARVVVRVKRLALGNAGDVEPVGEGVSELRIHFGPGYRVYFIRRRATVIVLLGGGDKSTQKNDIAAAKTLARRLKE
jgi:putative addiction module killer protein